MTGWFTAILNMSITASYVAVAVIIVRLLLRRAPKIFSYTLWAAVLVRLVFPISYSSGFSFLSFLAPNVQIGSGAMEYVPGAIGLMQSPEINVGADVINQMVNASLPPATPAASMNFTQLIIELAGIIWILGVILLLSYSIISYLRILHKLKTATLVQANVFESDRITTPFVYGFIKPRIVLPVGISGDERAYILAHEQTHIRRLDYLMKPLAFLVLIVHWFNPLMWISFALMTKDMEMSCDESVIRKLGSGVKASYSHSLLALSIKKSRLLSGSPLGFGESDIQARIKNVLNYKKPTFGVAAAGCVVSLVLLVGFTSNPPGKPEVAEDQLNQLASVWANALISRDGHPRYEMMSAAMKEQFKQEQIVRSGENWNYNIGVSSPWVVDYEIRIEGKTARITYLTQTSEPAFYQTEESLTFTNEEGKLVVAEYHTVYEDRPLFSSSSLSF